MGKTIPLAADDGHRLAAWRADPAGKPKGALVVIQEIFGVNAHIREVCDRFAAQGYLAVAPAVFDRAAKGVELGYQPADIEAGRALRARIRWDDALLDIAAAIGEARQGGRVGVVGFCWGGSLTWLAACRLGPDAAVGYYGGQIADFNAEGPRCPTLLHFGDQDQSIPMAAVEAVREAHPEVAVHVYPGAGHGFSCDHRASFHKASHEAAMKRTLDFFARHVG